MKRKESYYLAWQCGQPDHGELSQAAVQPGSEGAGSLGTWVCGTKKSLAFRTLQAEVSFEVDCRVPKLDHQAEGTQLSG